LMAQVLFALTQDGKDGTSVELEEDDGDRDVTLKEIIP